MRWLAEFVGERVDDPLNDFDKPVYSCLVVIATTCIQTGKRNIVSRMIVTPIDECLDFFSFRFDIHCQIRNLIANVFVCLDQDTTDMIRCNPGGTYSR